MSQLNFNWTLTSQPQGATVTYTLNNSSAAFNTVATFNVFGTYNFEVTVTNPAHKYVTSSVAVAVNQTLSSIVVVPSTAQEKW